MSVQIVETAGTVEQEPTATPVDGAAVLDELSNWIEEYYWFPQGRPAYDAVAAWVAATRFVDVLQFAPPLVLRSPTPGCGKTLLLDLIRHAVRHGILTSGLGITPATAFRLNESLRPTYLIDEAEKLATRRAGGELIDFINLGHRRGGSVLRMRETDHGNREPEVFDVYGFRALATTRDLWSTIMDRAVAPRLDKKPRELQRRRWKATEAEAEAKHFAERLEAWAAENADAVEAAQHETPRPEWLGDRACDNWSPLLAVGLVAGGGWSERLLDAARVLTEDAAHMNYEVLILDDIRAVFSDHGYPEAILSGKLVKALNELETSPWGDERRGQGISTNGLCKRMKSFNVVPRSGRVDGGSGENVRGYWLEDLSPVFDSYLELE